MVRPNRVKEYRFSVSDLTANSSGHVDVYTERPLNGTLQTIEWVAGNAGATGSIHIFESGGAALQVWGTISGTVRRNLGTSFAVFPKASTVSTADYSLSGTNTSWFSDIPLNTVLRVVGSSWGAGKSGLGLNIIYI